MLKILTSHHVLEMTTIIRQIYLDAVLHVVDTASKCHAVSLTDFVSNVLFQCVSCARLATEQSSREKK